MLQESKKTNQIIEQLANRQSVINYGDLYQQRKNKKEAIRLATYDMKDRLPPQMWYDSLRGNDDGSFSKTAITNKLQESDPIDYQHINGPSKKSILLSKSVS